MDDSKVDEGLDAWEEVLVDTPEKTPEEFLAECGIAFSKSERQRFLIEARALHQMNRKMACYSAKEADGEASDSAVAKAEDVGMLGPARGLARKIHSKVAPVSSVQKSKSKTVIRIESGTEIVAGYHLIETLGRGGFGEVWKASGPGGLEVALKLIPLNKKSQKIEKRALNAIKGVRHPNLLSIFGYWETDDYLIVASELADKSLAERLDEVIEGGGTGIPEGELHEYMREAAKGIDALNQAHRRGKRRIQHRDVKPQNLLLSGGSVKVGDFGLARAMHGQDTGHTGSLTVAYAAPECLNGKTSSTSDQYSLAVTYCELRGNRLPFRGSPLEIMSGHLGQDPDLSMIPEVERKVVSRALAKDPHKRWDSCGVFISKLTNQEASAPHLGGGIRPPRTFPLKRVLIALLACALLVFPAVIFLLRSGPGPDPLEPTNNGNEDFNVRVDFVHATELDDRPSVKVTNQSTDSSIHLVRIDLRDGSGTTISQRFDFHIPSTSSLLLGTDDLGGIGLKPKNQLQFHFANEQSIEYEIPAESLTERASKAGKGFFDSSKRWFNERFN